jgi:hypothetical protein
MLTAMPGGVRLIPVAVRSASTATRTARPAKGRTVTLSRHEYRYTEVPPEDRYERELGKRYRRIIAARIGGKTEVRPPAPVTTRGIAAAYEAAERRRNERHVEGVAYRLGLR